MKQNKSTQNSRRISRRRFLGLAAAGLLASCSPGQQQPAAAPTGAPPNTPPPALTNTPVPTATLPPTPAPVVTPTVVPTAAPSVARPEIIKFYPDIASKVVHTHHTGVWNGGQLSPEALRQMLDASITKLTGLNDAREAWAALFKPTEKIAIKVNAFRNSLIWTHVPLVMAVTDSLTEAGIPPEQIVIFDYYTNELETAGFTVNKDGPGMRCYGTDGDYTDGWTVEEKGVDLSNILLESDALINIPVLKSHMIAGLTFALKNHYGTTSYPDGLHRPIGPCVAGLNALPPIKDRTRLIIGDMLTACLKYSSGFPYWKPDWTGDSILMSFDPVAHDTVGLQTLTQLVKDKGDNTKVITTMGESCLKSGAEMGLGANDPNNMEVVEMKLG